MVRVVRWVGWPLRRLDVRELAHYRQSHRGSSAEPVGLQRPSPQPPQRTAGPRSAGRIARGDGTWASLPHEIRDGPALSPCAQT